MPPAASRWESLRKLLVPSQLFLLAGLAIGWILQVLGLLILLAVAVVAVILGQSVYILELRSRLWAAASKEVLSAEKRAKLLEDLHGFRDGIPELKELHPGAPKDTSRFRRWRRESLISLGETLGLDSRHVEAFERLEILDDNRLKRLPSLDEAEIILNLAIEKLEE